MDTRPLEPPETFETPHPGKQIKYGIKSDVGPVRSNNQDSALVLVTNPEMMGNPPAVSLFVVADGMGGHTDGEHASAIAVRTIAKHVMQQIVLPQLRSTDMNADTKTPPEVLSEAMEAAHTTVQAEFPNAGTTATCAVIRGELVYIAHIGDSRAYLIADGQIEVLTRDHTLVQRLIELGQLTEEEADVHPQKNVLYRSIGLGGESFEIDAATRRLPPSSHLLICSDGLWGVVNKEQMLGIIQSSRDPQEACDKLIMAAIENGTHDNVTAIVVRMPN